MTSLFENFFPNQRVQNNFAEKGLDNYLVMCDVMSGFFQVYRVPNKSAEQASLKVEEMWVVEPASNPRNGILHQLQGAKQRHGLTHR